VANATPFSFGEKEFAMFRYVSVDLETLGKDPYTCDIIEFGAVIDDGESPIDSLPFFHRYILPPTGTTPRHPRGGYYSGEPFAMAMHADKLVRIANLEEPYVYITPNELASQFWAFLVNEGLPVVGEDGVDVVAGGKNFQGFDMRFLRRVPKFTDRIHIHHRCHDPAELYFDPKMDEIPPGLDQCLARAGIKKSVEHSAVADALDVIRVLRYKWGIEC
jgi:hypothetical protein